MSFFDSALKFAKENLGNVFPALAAVSAAKDVLSEAVAERIRGEACAKAYALLAKTHRDVVTTIVWQNGALILSLAPVYYLHSAVPFYIAYAGVAGYSLIALGQQWPVVRKLCVTRSITATISGEVQLALEQELTQRQFYERKAVAWLGPDLKKISDEIAVKLKPDVVAAATNMATTLFLAFVAFRLFAIPLLEQQALTR